MFADAVRAAAARLHGLHAEFQPLFGRIEAQRHSLTYVRGLLTCQRSKTCEAIALDCSPGRNGAPPGRNEVMALQHFISNSFWDYLPVQEKIQELFARKLAPSAAGSPVGVVLVLDESGDEKSGPHSCGAATQWCGRAGKTSNCQMGVFAAGVAPAGVSLLHHRLYLPEDWAKDPARRERCHVPQNVPFLTKPQIAADLTQEIVAAGHVKIDWATADEVYGDSGEFLDTLEALHLRYVVAVRRNTLVFTQDPSTLMTPYPGHGRPATQPARKHRQQVAKLAAGLPDEAWQTVLLREGAKGPLVAQFARLRIWMVRHGRPHHEGWLLLRRDAKGSEVHYYLSNASREVTLETLALVSASRWRVEELFQDAKGYLGLADYEVRGWPSWHHHMSLVALAHLYVTLTRHDLGQVIPELTLDRAITLLQAAVGVPELTLEHAEHLTHYHLTQNRIAHESHRNSWLRKHNGLDPKLRL